MAVTLIAPPEPPAPFEPGPSTGSILLLAQPSLPRTNVGTIIFKVRDWDPRLHPRGYKGLFTSTPDRHKASQAAVGDIIATKTGKVFKVEGHGPKGIKVTSVDPDSGEILDKGTIVANDIEVAKIAGGKAPGTRHPISELDPGTYIQHPRSGKRFKVHKHGNWTTVYPVNSTGDVSGKHTVLPPNTEVIVSTQQAGGQVTQATVNQVQQAQAATAVPAPSTKPNPLGLKVGDFVKNRKTGEIHEVTISPATGQPLIEYPTGLGTFNAAEYERHVPEVLPKGLKHPPAPYQSGVGHGSVLSIEEMRGGTYRLKRVENAGNLDQAGDVLGSFTSISQARSSARKQSGAHEAIVETRKPTLDPADIKAGDWIMWGGAPRQVEEIVDPPSWAHAGTHSFRFKGSAYPNHVYPQQREDSYKVVDPEQYDHIAKTIGYFSHEEMFYAWQTHTLLESARDEIWSSQMRQQMDPKEVRPARPNLYLPQLQSDWDPTNLVGKSKGEALAALRKLGYGEILPREPNMTKYVNARGKRLHVHNKNGRVTSVDEIQTQATMGGGTGFYKQLADVLDSGGDLSALDPSKSAYPEERTSHTRQILFDMALGKQNGVEKVFDTGNGTIKVKSDQAYRDEIAKDGTFPKQASFADKVNEPGLNIPTRSDVMSTHWSGTVVQGNSVHATQLPPDAAENYATALIAAGERNGIAAMAKDPGTPAALRNTDYEDFAAKLADAWGEWSVNGTGPLTELSQGQRDYVINTLNEIAPRGQRQWGYRDTEFARRLQGVYDQAVADEIAKRRKVEGTVPARPGGDNTFELPLWNDIRMEKQDVFEVESLVQNAATKHTQVPIFFTGGILQDGVAYSLAHQRKTVITARVPQEFDAIAAQRVGGRVTTNSKHPSPSGSSFNRTSAGVMLLVEDGDKRIEYVPHDLHNQVAPTNQRGRLTLEGYTHEEAIQKLKDLGIVHEMEGEVPFNSIFRARRRYGVVAPLHSDYVSGTTPLPSIPAAVVHGMNSGNLTKVLETGGLLPIYERFKLGLPITGTIPLNDIRGGVDHVVFAAMHGSSYVAYGDAQVVFKDSAYLRRDVLVTDRAFGSGATRYPSYRRYQNKHRSNVGEKETNLNIYAPISPAARQSHINERMGRASSPSNLSAGNNEWDLAHGAPIEDWAIVSVRGQSQKQDLDRRLDQMVASGQISERPEVVVGLQTKQVERQFTRVDPRSLVRQ